MLGWYAVVQKWDMGRKHNYVNRLKLYSACNEFNINLNECISSINYLYHYY